MSQNTSQHQVVAQAVSVNLPKIEPKTAPFLLASMAGEPSDWSTFFQQAILSLSLNIRLRFSRFISFFKSNLQVAEKISQLKADYENKRSFLAEFKAISSFDEILKCDPAICNALKELEIRWLFGASKVVDKEFEEISQKIQSIEVLSSPRGPEKEDVNQSQEKNENVITSIADLISKVVDILSGATSKSSSFKHQA